MTLTRPDAPVSYRDLRPGLSVPRLARLVREAVDRLQLDFSGVKVLTEAATGPYAVTPVLAALAGGQVTAITRDTRYGTVAEVREATFALAEHLGVAGRIVITKQRSPALFADADVITNSGHLRPITGELADAIRADAVIPLMMEAWEIQAGRFDLDLDRLRARGVRIAGTNERHPNSDVFSYLGPAAVAQLADAGVSVYGGRIAVLCDNAFRDYLQDGLQRVGAQQVTVAASLDELPADLRPDALVVSLTPTGASVLSAAQLGWLAANWPDVVITQYWGDVDRAACARAGLVCWPLNPPPEGHMGELPSRVGPEPGVRLQSSGLKVGQVLLKSPAERTPADSAYLDELA